MDKILYENLKEIEICSNMDIIILKNNIRIIHTQANSIAIYKDNNIVMYIPFNHIRYIHTIKLDENNLPSKVFLKFWECR